MSAAGSRISSWVGVLAQLRRVDQEHLGRLVLVEHTAVAQAIGQQGLDPVPAWHVFVLGERLRLEGDTWREVEVAEPCLQPLCRLPPVIAELAIEGQAEMDFDEAIHELRDHLVRYPLTDGQLDASLEQAAIKASGPRVWPALPVRWV